MVSLRYLSMVQLAIYLHVYSSLIEPKQKGPGRGSRPLACSLLFLHGNGFMNFMNLLPKYNVHFIRKNKAVFLKCRDRPCVIN